MRGQKNYRWSQKSSGIIEEIIGGDIIMSSDAVEQTPLEKVLERFRVAAVSEREKGNYFEEFIVAYLKHG